MKCSASLAGPSPCRFPMYLPRGTSAKLLNQDLVALCLVQLRRSAIVSILAP